MRSGPALPMKNRCMSFMSAPGRGNGASARLRPVASPPTKLTPASAPLSAPGSSNLDAFATAQPLFLTSLRSYVAFVRCFRSSLP